MNDHNKTRENVSNAYAKAVTEKKGCCCNAPVQKGVVAKLAGYTEKEIASLPPDAIINSFGCGNPVALSELREGDVVLDLGAGASIDILLAAKIIGPKGRAIGIDMTDEMITQAKENIATTGLTNLEVRKGVIENLPVETESIDWVISNCVINLSPEKSKVFAEIARVLKPGGQMLVSDIVAQDLPDVVRKNKALYNSCVAGAISEQEYVAGLAQAGLQNIAVRERLVYDAIQLASFFTSELDQTVQCCGGGALDPKTLKQLAETVVGKVYSAKIYARKPNAS
ncbi:MAG: arsenite methyltransferase [Pseudomonadota bacterium]